MKRMGDLHYHLERTHCETCGADFGSEDALVLHERAIHPATLS